MLQQYCKFITQNDKIDFSCCEIKYEFYLKAFHVVFQLPNSVLPTTSLVIFHENFL